MRTRYGSSERARRTATPTATPTATVAPASSDFGRRSGRTCGAGRASTRTTPSGRAANRTCRDPTRRGACSVAVARLAGDGALVAEALAVVGLFVADVLGAVLGVADVAQPVGAGEVGAARGLVEQARRVEAEDLGASGGAARARRAPRAGRPPAPATRRSAPARSAARSPCRTASAAMRSLKTSSSPARTPSTASRKTAWRPGRGLAEGADDARHALVVRARDPAAVVALARRHVQHSQELAEVHSR